MPNPSEPIELREAHIFIGFMVSTLCLVGLLELGAATIGPSPPPGVVEALLIAWIISTFTFRTGTTIDPAQRTVGRWFGFLKYPVLRRRAVPIATSGTVRLARTSRRVGKMMTIGWGDVSVPVEGGQSLVIGGDQNFKVATELGERVAAALSLKFELPEFESSKYRAPSRKKSPATSGEVDAQERT